MKRVLTKIAVLAAVFAATVIIASAFLNNDNIQSTSERSEPTLPVLAMRYDGTTINRMYGYSREMDEKTLRDCVTLISTSRTLTLEVDAHEAKIDEINYRVTSFEDGSVIENGRIKTFSNDGSVLYADFSIEEPIPMGQEYMLRFEVKTNLGTHYYYTRLLQRGGQNLNWYLEFVQGFYANCISKNVTAEMKKQLEPEAASASSSLHSVNIHSDLDQVTWGELSPTLVKKAVPTILEVNETTVSIQLQYIISAKNTKDNIEYYNVTEFYRMRKAQDYVVLLDFERETTQFFDGSSQESGSEGVDLGITGKDVSYIANSSSDVAAFIQCGEIWEYDRGANKACRVFTFNGNNYLDDRTTHSDYGLSISSVNDDGSVTFIVYGYMNAGAHEGETGISICRYYADRNMTEELLFIESDRGFKILERSLSRLAYVNQYEQCFLCYGDSINAVSLADNTSYILQENLDWKTFSVSDSQILVGWMAAEDGKASVNQLNLDTGDTLKIEAPDGQQIKSLGFIGENLIYGLAYDSDCYTDAMGNDIFLMYKICLSDAEGKVVKEYEMPGVYITGIERDDLIINLKRVMKNDTGGTNTVPDDQLLSYETEDVYAVSVKLTVTEKKGTVVSLVFAAQGGEAGLLRLDSRYIESAEQNTLQIEDTSEDKEEYFVYGKGRLIEIYTEVNEAIEAANDNVGVVLNDIQQYVWERGNLQTTVKLDIASVPAELLEAPLDENTIKSIIGDHYQVWNLTGCDLSSVEYQVSSGYPVIGKWSDTESVIIMGYDQYNIWIYDKETGELKAIASDDATAQFAAYDNTFMSYHISYA